MSVCGYLFVLLVSSGFHSNFVSFAALLNVDSSSVNCGFDFGDEFGITCMLNRYEICSNQTKESVEHSEVHGKLQSQW